MEWRTAPPLVVGSRVAFVARFLGRPLVYTYEVRELVPGSRPVMSTDARPFPMETTYEWADADGGRTLMSLRNRGGPTGFAGVASRRLSRLPPLHAQPPRASPAIRAEPLLVVLLEPATNG